MFRNVAAAVMPYIQESARNRKEDNDIGLFSAEGGPVALTRILSQEDQPTRFREPTGSIGFFMMTMCRPLCFASALAGVFLGGAAAAGEEATSQAAPVKEVPAVAPAPVRAASPLISSMIAAGLPKYAPPKPADGPAVPAAEVQTDQANPNNATIVHLPSVIVRDRKLPKESEILSKKEMAQRGMDTYIGPENGIDRGGLNLFTPVASLWQHLPFFGHHRLLDFETNEQRGLRLYQEAARRQELEDLNFLKAADQKSDSGSKPPPPGRP